MALSLVVDNLETVPDNVRSLYVEKDGKFQLAIDGYEDPKNLKSALEKERQAAREAAKAKSDLEKRFEGIDPDEFKTLKQQREEAEEARLKAEGKADEIAEKRAEKMREEIKKQEALARAEIEKYKAIAKSRDDKVLEGQIMAAATGKVISDPEAMRIVAMMAKNIFTLSDDSEAVQLDSEGRVVVGKDGSTPYQPKEWIESLRETHPFLFPNGNTGGGATGSRGGVTSNKVMKRDAFFKMHPTQQGAFMKGGGSLID